MSFGAHILSAVEEVLAEGFEYHDALDAFVRRSGVSEADLSAAREQAEQRAKKSPRPYSRAPKRFVAQALLTCLTERGDAGERMLANLVTALCSGEFPNAAPKAQAAIGILKDQREKGRKEREVIRQQEIDERARRDNEAATIKSRQAIERQAARDKLRERFTALMELTDVQARGYMLEVFLNELFTIEGLQPRGSFKLTGEQIDGSFSWGMRTHLLEARWVKEPIAGAGFSSLMYKIEGKTADTRGLFVSINGYSQDAIKGLHTKGALRFVCMDGAHIMRSLFPGGSLTAVLEEVWRHADETGEPYLPVAKMRS